MSNRWTSLAVILLLAVPCVLIGQTEDSEPASQSEMSQKSLVNSLSSGFGLLDPAKFSMSHSYSVSYFSGSGSGVMTGLYMNTMKYAFSDPLSLTVHLGYLHRPFSSSDTQGMPTDNSVLSGFELLYQPRKNFFLKIEYGAIPNQYGQHYWGVNRSNW